MSPELSWNRYGKSGVRLLKLRRSRDRHEIVDLSLDVQLEGAFEPVFVEGDNRLCLATDTMKNTVYAFARREPIDQVEGFAIRLANHFIQKAGVSRVRVSAIERQWSRLLVNGQPHPHAFVQPGGEYWTTRVERKTQETEVVSGLAGLIVMKTTDSAFAGFPRDEFTTLPETGDRILATSVTATWKYGPGTTDFGGRERIRTALVETFAAHTSQSVQQTLYAMAAAALAACAQITEITMRLPNRHHLLVDLAPFGLDNPDEIFVAIDHPYGLIEATVRRT
jgi:urate oxidase